MIDDFYEQVRAIRDADDIVWIKFESESRSFSKSKRKPKALNYRPMSEAAVKRHKLRKK